MLPSDFPSMELCPKWSRDGTLEEINDVLRDRLRRKRGRKWSPSIGVIDYQSVKTTRIGGEHRGINGGMKIKGRKRYIITDTQGLLLAITVQAANSHDSKTAFDVISELKWRFERIKKIYTDGGYRGEVIDQVKDIFQYDIEITLRTDKSIDFKTIPQRGIVERSFSWLESFRRDCQLNCVRKKQITFT